MKKMALLVFWGLMVSASAGAADSPTVPEMSDLVKTRGQAVRMSHQKAKAYCKKLGRRLPTIRELALFAEYFGAVLSERKLPGDFFEVMGSDTEGNPDPFYYTEHRFSSFFTTLRGVGQIWSSSVYPRDPNYTYVLYGNTGGIMPTFREGRFGCAVMCVER